MRGIGVCFLGLCLFVFSSFAHTAETGRLGAGLTLYSVNIDDPDGDAADTTEAGVNLIYLDDLSRDTRYYAEFSYLDFRVGVEPGKIGQDVSRLGISAIFQKRFRQFRSFKPWLGAGLGIFQEEYSRRHTVDSAGFLAATYPNRDVTQLTVAVDAMHEWQITHNVEFALRLRYDVGLNEGMDGFSASVLFLY